MYYLCAPPPDNPENHVNVISSLAGYPCQRTIDAAGHGFEKWAAKNIKGYIDETPPSSPTTSGGSKSKKKKEEPPPKKTEKIKTKKLSDAELQQDHYAILGLGDLQWRASEEMVKATYRKIVLTLHPDKPGGSEERFKEAQIAYEVLTSKEKRLAYDSSLPCDDDLPPAKVPPEQFFQIYGPCFQMNSRWSVVRNVPPLGDTNTPYAKVDAFYDFWYTFKSWRDFSVDDEYCVDDAECREERRFMERENERQREKNKKEEAKRIRALVDNAYKCDPRLKRRRQEEIAQKEAERTQRRKEKEEAERKVREEEAERKRLAEEAAKKEKAENKAKKDAARKMRSQTRGSLDPFFTTDYSNELRPDCIRKDDLDFCLGRLEPDELNQFTQLLLTTQQPHTPTPTLGKPFHIDSCEAVVEIVNEHIAQVEKQGGVDRFGNKINVKTHVKKESKGEKQRKVDVDWTEEELIELTKAVIKYPGGTNCRWDQIAIFIGTGKTAEQVLRKTKEMQNQLNDATAPKKPTAIKQGDAKPLASEEEVVEKKKKEEDVWTQAQQKQLEEAIRTMKPYKEADKWDKIAGMVDGKTIKQCKLRYKRLSELSGKR